MKYNDTVTRHFHSPVNHGVMDDADAVGDADNAVCLDTMRLYLKVSRGVVSRASFQAGGCAPTIACGSFITEWIIGRRVDELRALDAGALEGAVGGLPATKKHAALLAVETLQRALNALDTTPG